VGAVLIVAAACTASPAAAKPPGATALAAGPSCSEVEYCDLEYNYAGVADGWKTAASHADGGQGTLHHDVSERYTLGEARSPVRGFPRA
jgi:hypothetical protein